MAITWSWSTRSSGPAPGLPWLARSPLGQGVVLFAAAVAVIVLIPLAVLALLFGVLAAGWIGLRRGLLRMRQPNGALDGRRNVRVRMPESDAGA